MYICLVAAKLAAAGSFVQNGISLTRISCKFEVPDVS